MLQFWVEVLDDLLFHRILSACVAGFLWLWRAAGGTENVNVTLRHDDGKPFDLHKSGFYVIYAQNVKGPIRKVKGGTLHGPVEYFGLGARLTITIQCSGPSVIYNNIHVQITEDQRSLFIILPSYPDIQRDLGL